jgi:hypothetical protein
MTTVYAPDVQLGSPPYIEPSGDWLNPRNLQPTFEACQQQCLGLASKGCGVGTYITAGERKGECWLSAAHPSKEQTLGSGYYTEQIYDAEAGEWRTEAVKLDEDTSKHYDNLNHSIAVHKCGFPCQSFTMNAIVHDATILWGKHAFMTGELAPQHFMAHAKPHQAWAKVCSHTHCKVRFKLTILGHSSVHLFVVCSLTHTLGGFRQGERVWHV